MKFTIENVASAAEIDIARQSVGRTSTIAKIVIWTATVVLLSLVYPFGQWVAGQLSPLAPDSYGPSAVVWVIQSGLIVFGACVSFVVAGLSLVRWPFQKAIELNRLLQPLEYFEAEHLVQITEANLALDKYRNAVATVREFVKGDYELLRDHEQAASKLAQVTKQDHERPKPFSPNCIALSSQGKASMSIAKMDWCEELIVRTDFGHSSDPDHKTIVAIPARQKKKAARALAEACA